jgi:putative acetyltransferase
MSGSGNVQVREEPIGSPIARTLIAELDAELSRHYPPAQRFHDLPATDVAEGRGRFLVAWLDDAPVGCGAVRMLSASAAELKRMYVVPDARGRGLSRAILAALEAEAAHLGATTVVLETGDQQHAALGLYQSAGFVRRPCFGAYAASPSSVCLQKRLGPPLTLRAGRG